MRRTILRLTIAAAAMVAVAACVQAETMKAEIPFPFQAAGARMEAGSYMVRMVHSVSGAPTVQIVNLEHRQRILAMPVSTDAPFSATNAEAVMGFACTEGNCELSFVRDGEATVHHFVKGKGGPGTRIAMIALHAGRVE